MKIDINKIEHLMAAQMISKGELAETMGKSSSWLSVQLARARSGAEFEPRTVGLFAHGLGVSTEAITEVAA